MKSTTFCFLAFAFVAQSALAQSDPLRGLWVGEARLNYASEVTVPLDEDNNPEAPIVDRPTKTFDVANIRLILHVNGAGQVSLLKEVALLKRTDDILADSDLALVTDPRLYAEFPGQPAQRIASVVFDFGDQKATDAVQAVMNAAATAAADEINRTSSTTLAAARALADAAAQAVVDSADAEAAFDAFLAANLSMVQVSAIAASGDASAARTAAEALRDGPVGQESFYQDARGVAMVDAILAAVAAAGTPEEKEAAAQNTAAAFADVDNQYQRFIAGKIFGDFIAPAAAAAAELGALRPITSFTGVAGQAPVEVTSANHGLNSGDTAVISGTGIGAYDAAHTITRTGENTFTLPVDFVAGGAIAALDGALNAAPLEITSATHGLATGDKIIISNAGVPSYNGEHTVTVVDADTFTIDVEVEAPVGGLGQWAPVLGGGWNFPENLIRAAAEAVPEENDAQEEAIQIKVDGYADTRGADAIAAVVNAIVAGAAASDTVTPAVLASTLVEVGREALASDVTRYPLPEMEPTGDYNDFVRAANTQQPENFLTSPGIAAAAAAEAAFEEREENPLHNDTSVKNKALAAAAEALETVFGAAARAIRTELPMDGTFAVGEGDPRLRGELAPGVDLGLPAITGTVVLPAMHPTNPFRHRRHRDHTIGFDIVRKLRLDFDGEPGDPLDRAGFGVNRITGTYREEITKPDNKAGGGLHKPLGTNQDRGLIVEGKFELSRISLIDTLNAK